MLKSTRKIFISMPMHYGILYFTCATHVNIMGSHIVRAVLITDLYKKLA